MVVIGDRVRADAAGTVAWFAAEGVKVKVVSGDHPRTVGAVAGQVGIAGADHPVDARTLPEGQAELADLVEARSVFGRVVPHQKRAMVAALGARGHVVAMTGDGVNDVLALKDADLGIAMGGGSAASRAVAELVLMDGRFATLPAVMAEGRRVIANIERVAKLFVTKTVYATVLALAVGLAGLAFPFLPRHLTLISSLTIGIPGFFLALEPSTQRSHPGFVRRTLAFALPAGLVAALGTLVAYQVADVANVPQDQARTTATLALAGLGLVVLALAARPLNPLRRLLLAAMAAAFAVVLLVPSLRAFFALDLPPLQVATDHHGPGRRPRRYSCPCSFSACGSEGVPHPPGRGVGSSQHKASRLAQFPRRGLVAAATQGLGFANAAPSQARHRARTRATATRSRRSPPLPAALGARRGGPGPAEHGHAPAPGRPRPGRRRRPRGP